MTRKMKDSGVEWMGEIPEDWEVWKLKYMFDIKGGIGFPERFQGGKEGDYPFYKVSDINHKEMYVNSANNYVTKEIANENRFNIIPRNSILISKIGEALKKNHRKINTSDCIIDNNLQALITNGNYKYSYYLLSVIDMLWFDNNGTIPSINNEKLKNFMIPNINIEKQKSIANFLDKKTQEIDNIISKTKEVIEEYKKYKQSLITETVTKGLDKNAPMKDSGIEWIGDIPEHWDVRRLKTLVKLTEDKEIYNPKVDLYIGLENVESHTGRYINTDTKYGENLYTTFEFNDLLFSTLRPYLTKVYLAESEGFCTSEFLIINQYAGIKKYLFYQLINFKFIDLINSSTYGSKMPRANWSFIKDIFLSIAPIEEQEQIANYLDEKCSQIDQIISTKEKLLIEMESYKKSLIYETVTGKREVE